MGVSPPPFHEGFSGRPRHHDLSRGGLGGLGQGSSLAGEGTPRRGSGKLSPPSAYAPSPVGPGRAGAAPGRGGGPGRRLGPPRRPRGRADALAGRAADGRAGASPRARRSLGGVTGSRGARRARERPAAGGPRPRAGTGRSPGPARGVGVGAGENEWRLPGGAGGARRLGVPADGRAAAAPRSGGACGCVIDGERQLPKVCRGDSEGTAICRATPRRPFIHLGNCRATSLPSGRP